MEFYDPIPLCWRVMSGFWDSHGEKTPEPVSFYERYISGLLSGEFKKPLGRSNWTVGDFYDPEEEAAYASMEQTWFHHRRPYYKLWPKIIDPLCKIDLGNLRTDEIHVPLDVFAIRFPTSSHDVIYDGMLVESVLVGYWPTTDGGRSVIARVASESKGLVSFDFEISLKSGCLVRDVMPTKVSQSELGRLVVSVCLLASGNYDDIVTPDILSRDRSKWDETRDHAIVDRAIRRGKLGWDIGREIHCSPHWRRPHAALYHVGKGRSQSRIVFRKGGLVRRDDAAKVPTGYMDDEVGVT